MRTPCEAIRGLTPICLAFSEAEGVGVMPRCAAKSVGHDSESHMSEAMLRRPFPRKAGRKAQPARVARVVKRLSRQDMLSRRDACMALIARLRNDRGPPSDMFQKASQLLTRHWSASSWRERADIVRSAEWLIGIGKEASNATFGDENAGKPHALRGARPDNRPSGLISEPPR